MLLGEFVHIEIQGRALPDVAAVNRSLVHEGTHVWLLNAEQRLEIRPVEILFRGYDEYLVGDGLDDGDLLITTDLPAPVQGMPLRTGDQTPARGEGARTS
jgi:hypothetical protein